MRLVIAFLSAAILPSLLMTAWYLYGQFTTFESSDPYIWVRTGGFLSLCIMVSLAYVIVLGAPAYYLLRKLKAVWWWSTIATGFILGAIPMALFTWPLNPGNKTSASINGVQTIIDGVPTIEGWLQFVYGVSFVGLCGMVGALAFWLVAP